MIVNEHVHSTCTLGGEGEREQAQSFELGSGSFAREKYVFLQFAGPNTGAVKRGRHVGQAAIVKEAMGGASQRGEFSIQSVSSNDLNPVCMRQAHTLRWFSTTMKR